MEIDMHQAVCAICGKKPERWIQKEGKRIFSSCHNAEPICLIDFIEREGYTEEKV